MGHVLEVATPLAAKYVIWGWSALEDAERLKTLERKPTQRLLHAERHLRASAIWLRVALEEQFGGFSAVPNQDLMAFVTVVRHASAHRSAMSSKANPKHLDVRWHEGRGRVEAKVELIFDLEGARGAKAEWIPLAQRYLDSHAGNVFKALHAAVRAAAGWANVDLDDDFEKLQDAPVGRETLRIPMASRKEFDAVVRGLKTGRAFNMGDISKELPEDAPAA